MLVMKMLTMQRTKSMMFKAMFLIVCMIFAFTDQDGLSARDVVKQSISDAGQSIDSIHERYILRIRSRSGSRIEEAWVSLTIRDMNENTLDRQAPLYYRYEPIGNGMYQLEIPSYRLEGKSLELNVHSEGHKHYTVSIGRLNRDITVILEPI